MSILNKANRHAVLFCAMVTIAAANGGAGSEDMSPETKIFDFEQEQTEWRNIDDVVMGGVSDSEFHTKNGLAVFKGTVSLENNGGFASVRTLPGEYDLSAYDGIALRVKTNGKKYDIRLRMTRAFDGVSYAAPIADNGGEWATVRFPFDRFKPVFHGRSVPDAPKLDPAKVSTFGFLISDKQEGPFRLDIDWIGAYKNDAPEETP